MTDTAPMKHLKSLAGEFARAAKVCRGDIVLEFPGARETVPALDLSPFAAKTEEALGAAQSRYYKEATAAAMELYAMVQKKMRERQEQESRASGKDKADLKEEYEFFKACDFLIGETLTSLEKDAQADSNRRAVEEPLALLRLTEDLARYPRQLGNDNIMTLIRCAAVNMVRQEKQMQSMSREIDELKTRLEEKEKTLATLGKIRIPPRPI